VPEPSGVEDAASARALLLDGVAASRDLHELHTQLGDLHHRGSNFPARPLLELAADTFALIGATRDHPLELAGLTESVMPDWSPHGNTARQKHGYAMTAVVLIAAGAEPEDVGWWRVDDLWHHAFFAAVTYLRAAAAEHRTDVATICAQLR
jgi:hypothetical protein